MYRFSEIADMVELGAKRADQAIGNLFLQYMGGESGEFTSDVSNIDWTQPICACAMGMACLGMSEKTGKSVQELLLEDGGDKSTFWHPDFADRAGIECPDERCINNPICHFPYPSMQAIITHLNDRHEWLPNQIANWLRSLDEANQ